MINESFISKKIEASTLSDLDKNFLLNVWGLEDPFVRHLNAPTPCRFWILHYLSSNLIIPCFKR